MDEQYESEYDGHRGYRRWLCTLFATCFCFSVAVTPAMASQGSGTVRSVVPLGHTAGIKLFSDGLLVVNLSETGASGDSPARTCGIRTGDLILELNDEDLKSTEQFQAALQENGDRPVSLTVKRGAKRLMMTATPISGNDGVYRIGAWVRDSMAGIGTMTYYDPERNTFGALGHGITDVDTAQLMPISSGSLIPSTVASVKKGAGGTPGELTGEFETGHELGTLTCNSSLGVFGTMTDTEGVPTKTVPVARRDEVRCGDATILSNIEGDRVEEFSVNIMKIIDNAEKNENGRDMMLRVTDERLLAKTGGIVQGMSGSPILQDGKIIGAVTHVLLSDPAKGYGILIEHMLDGES